MSSDTTLHQYILGGRPERDIICFLESNPNAANVQDQHGNYPLLLACHYANTKRQLIMRLIKLYPDAIQNVCWGDRSTNPMHLACLWKNVDLAKLIFKANPLLLSLTNEKDKTPIAIACKSNANLIIDYLLKFPNKTFHQAIAAGVNGTKLRSLLAKDPKLARTKDSNGNSPLFLACAYYSKHKYHNNCKLIADLIKIHPKAIIEDNWEDHTTNPVHIASCMKKAALVKLLLDKNPFLANSANENNDTPLSIACKKNAHNIINYLLKFPSVTIQKAISQGVTENMLRHILSKKPQLANELDEDANYPLFTACISLPKNEYLICDLIKLYPDAIKQSGWKCGYTNPLHVATWRDDESKLELLLERNQALINYKDSQGMTPLAIACIQGYKHIVDVLLRYPILDVMKKLGFYNDTALHFAKCPFIHTKVFMRYGILTNVTNSNGETPFMNFVQALLLDPTVIQEEECNVILLYLEKVPSLIYEYNEGNYVGPSNGMVNFEYKLIHQIIRLNNPQLLEIVLDTLHDASDVINDATNKVGLTPLHLTCGAHPFTIMEQNRNRNVDKWIMEQNQNRCRRKLLQFSCIDVNKKSKVGCTALHFACYSKNTAAVEDLIHHSNTILNLYDLAGRNPLHAAMIINEHTLNSYLAIFPVMTKLLNHEESLVLTKDNEGHTIKYTLYEMEEALPRTQSDSVEFSSINNCLKDMISIVKEFENKARWKIMQFISGREMDY